jgi:two-component system nitrogen regulation response regulator GlnG
LQQSAKQLGVEPKRISDAALAQLQLFSFPGNVRQLENVCHWLTVMAPAQVIEAKDLPPEVMGLPDVLASSARLGHVHSSPAVLSGVGSVLDGLPPAAPEVEFVGGLVGDGGHERAVVPLAPAVASGVAGAATGWELGLEAEALELLATDRNDVWDVLSRRFESKLILTALHNTRGRRIEAAQKLGIGRNTITRKIQELGLE